MLECGTCKRIYRVKVGDLVQCPSCVLRPRLTWVPSPQQIQRACEKIQAQWTESAEYSHRVERIRDGLHLPPLEITTVSKGWHRKRKPARRE